jgi:hypothetical protein
MKILKGKPKMTVASMDVVGWNLIYMAVSSLHTSSSILFLYSVHLLCFALDPPCQDASITETHA